MLVKQKNVACDDAYKVDMSEVKNNLDKQLGRRVHWEQNPIHESNKRKFHKTISETKKPNK